MTAAKRTREAAYDRTGYANVADKFVTCVQREGSFSITTEDCRNLLALISERDAMREALKLCMESMIDAHDPDFTPCLMHEHGIDDCICQLSVHFRKGVKALAIADGAE